ncbi:NrsF family protein [Cypionkella sinensis]|uniref:NrsF family protein n=1 Tax=Cypionkella sinensis TaxID=1756043 RepID=A0ABV7J2D9_9RHOB
MMRTDDLIARLAGEAASQPFSRGLLGAMMAVSIIVPIAAFLSVLGTRPGLLQAWSNPVVPFKTLLPLITCALSMTLVLRLTRPEARAGVVVWAYALPLVSAVVLWGGAFAMRPPPARFAEVGVFSLAECLGSILVLAIVPVAAMLRMARRGATTSPALTAALIGLTAATGVTTGYSLFCTRDNPLFFVTWYGVAIVIVTAVSALVGRRLLHW